MPIIRAALERGQRVRMTVSGTSMLPFLRDNDVVELAPAPALRPGSAVLVRIEDRQGAAERYVLHRIVRMDGSGTFSIRGDAQRHSEGPFTSDAVLGVVTTAWRNGRMRPLDRGLWRIAGRVWLGVHPLGAGLLRAAGVVRRVGGRALRRLQRAPAWRAWAKRFRPAYAIHEATSSDLVMLDATLAATDTPCLLGAEQHANPRLTNYVAMSGPGEIGLVRLMRHPEADSPHVGYWLYSLEVRPRYRGMGIGEALTQRVIDQSRVEGAEELFLYVFEDNLSAIALYRKLGFERCRCRRSKRNWRPMRNNTGGGACR
jgi:ribosomal protein S18 acetylase RimI-like enzyme